MTMKCPHCGKPIPDHIVSFYAGKIGGKKIAERGSDYFRELQAKRKTRGGGRPRKRAVATPKNFIDTATAAV